MRSLPAQRVQADEQWSFCGSKQRNAARPGQGDLWVFAAQDADSKLVISYLVGARNTENTYAFMEDLAQRVKGRIQLTTDGWGAYLGAVRYAFGFGRCDYASIVKEYASPTEEERRRYSPPICTAVHKVRMIGRPDMAEVSTSYVEALNLATRQHCKRFARLTIAHSKKQENHAHATALHFFAHNFIRVHSTLTKENGGRKTTPAMASNLTDRPWTVEDLLTLMDPESVTIK
jgi:IS1 family transposase